MILGAALSRGRHLFRNSRFQISSFCLFYGFDRFVGLISLEKGLLWSIKEELKDYIVMFYSQYQSLFLDFRRGAYLIFVILGAALIRVRCLIEGGAYLETPHLVAALIRGRRL